VGWLRRKEEKDKEGCCLRQQEAAGKNVRLLLHSSRERVKEKLMTAVSRIGNPPVSGFEGGKAVPYHLQAE